MNNIFDGDSYQALFARAIYKRLMSREWITHADVMADYMGKKELPYNITNCEQYGELKKAWLKVRHTIEHQCAGSIETRGNLKNREYRYIGENPNPLEGMLVAAIKKNLKDYFQFCQDSAGFFPRAWLEYFFAQTLDLFEIDRKKQEGRQIIGSSIDRIYKNIALLPFIYECIRDRKVLQLTYCEKYQSKKEIIFHPHYLKEYNGRWFIFGHAQDRKPSDGYSIALDRIEGKPQVITEATYQVARVKYPDFFDDIIGTTHNRKAKRCEITIRVHSQYMFGLVESKPLHRKQEVLLPFDAQRGYAEIRVNLCPNKEFYGRVLQYGAEMEIISPMDVRNEIAKRISNMSSLYTK